MGVLNVTPDSFSDGGRWATTDTAIRHGLDLVADGADIIDVGGESTRPGATRPLVADELARVVPVIRALADEGVTISVDTMRAEVAAAAVEAGAKIVNDVSGGLADPDVLRVVAETGVDYVVMHWRAHSLDMADHARYDDPGGVVAAVRSELAQRVDEAAVVGVRPSQIILDPGLGFAKTPDHNWELIAGLDSLETLGLPILVGASRKTFLGHLLADEAGPRPVDARESSHTALVTLLAERGVWGLRVHDVRACSDALRVVERLAEVRHTEEKPE